MSVIIIAFIFLFLFKSKFEKNVEYLSLKQTTCVNGLFILFVFFRHLVGYVSFDGVLDKPMVILDGKLMQLLVVMFLFNSGFGIAESIRTKSEYIRAIPIKRILNVWLQFAICVTVYILIQLYRHQVYSPKEIALAYTGWTSVGNSTWYIMAMLILWFSTWIAFSIKRTGLLPFILVLLLTCVYVAFMKYVGRPSYRYNTVIAYPLGMFYSYFKNKIDDYFSKNKSWTLFIAADALAFIVTYHFAARSFFIYEGAVIAFALLIVFLSMRIKIGNSISYWLGKNLFGLYMLQRIPMIILADNLFIITHKYLYAFLCFILMLLLGWGFNKLFKILWNRLIP